VEEMLEIIEIDLFSFAITVFWISRYTQATIDWECFDNPAQMTFEDASNYMSEKKQMIKRILRKGADYFEITEVYQRFLSLLTFLVDTFDGLTKVSSPTESKPSLQVLSFMRTEFVKACKQVGGQIVTIPSKLAQCSSVTDMLEEDTDRSYGNLESFSVDDWKDLMVAFAVADTYSILQYDNEIAGCDVIYNNLVALQRLLKRRIFTRYRVDMNNDTLCLETASIIDFITPIAFQILSWHQRLIFESLGKSTRAVHLHYQEMVEIMGLVVDCGTKYAIESKYEATLTTRTMENRRNRYEVTKQVWKLKNFVLEFAIKYEMNEDYRLLPMMFTGSMVEKYAGTLTNVKLADALASSLYNALRLGESYRNGEESVLNIWTEILQLIISLLMNLTERLKLEPQTLHLRHSETSLITMHFLLTDQLYQQVLERMCVRSEQMAIDLKVNLMLLWKEWMLCHETFIKVPTLMNSICEAFARVRVLDFLVSHNSYNSVAQRPLVAMMESIQLTCELAYETNISFGLDSELALTNIRALEEYVRSLELLLELNLFQKEIIHPTIKRWNEDSDDFPFTQQYITNVQELTDTFVETINPLEVYIDTFFHNSPSAGQILGWAALPCAIETRLSSISTKNVQIQATLKSIALEWQQHYEVHLKRMEIRECRERNRCWEVRDYQSSGLRHISHETLSSPWELFRYI
jgi:hypothetical protein